MDLDPHPSWDTHLPLVPAADRRRAKRWKGDLTMQQHQALQLYASPRYRNVNVCLRDVDDPRYELLTRDERLSGARLHDVLATISPLTLSEPAVLWRGSQLPEHLMQRGRWTDPAWVSCTTDMEHARFAAAGSPENMTGELLRLELDAGCQYLPISYAFCGHDEIMCEHEIVLAPGHRFRMEEDGPVSRVRVWAPWEL